MGSSISQKKYDECPSPAVRIDAVKNKWNTSMVTAGYVFFGLFIFNMIFGFATGYYLLITNNIVWVCLAPLFIFVYGRMVPLEVKITPEGSAWVNFGVNTVGVSELKNTVVRDATDKDLGPPMYNAPGMSWCESRTIETSIVIEGTMKTLCGTKRYFYCVPRSQELSALIQGAVAGSDKVMLA